MKDGKSQLPQTDPRNVLRYTHLVAHKGGRWVW